MKQNGRWQIILRYGGLLALFLIALSVAERGTLGAPDTGLYGGVVAIIFLIVGIIVAQSFISRKVASDDTDDRIEAETLRDVPDLTVREKDMILFLSNGLTNKEIAEALGVSENTIKTHLKSLYQKLDVKNRTEAVAEARFFGFLSQ